MNTTELTGLEVQIDSLIDSIKQLRHENQALRSKLSHSLRNRSRLQETKQQATAQIKRIISQLKEEL